MGEAILPSMWRETLLHPLTVHFPIALLIVVVLIESARFAIHTFAPQSTLVSKLRFTSTLILILGVPSAWLAIYTGELSHSEVNRVICDPTVTGEHEYYAWVSAYAFSVALVLRLTLNYEGLGARIKRVFVATIAIVYFIALLIGAGALTYAGHLGASLVYQQAAGVYVPSPECKEFE